MPSNPVCLARKIAKISGSGSSTTVANFEASFAADAILNKFDGNILDKPMPMGTVYTATENPAPQTPSSAGQAFAGSPSANTGVAIASFKQQLLFPMQPTVLLLIESKSPVLPSYAGHALSTRTVCRERVCLRVCLLFGIAANITLNYCCQSFQVPRAD